MEQHSRKIHEWTLRPDLRQTRSVFLSLYHCKWILPVSHGALCRRVMVFVRKGTCFRSNSPIPMSYWSTSLSKERTGSHSKGGHLRSLTKSSMMMDLNDLYDTVFVGWRGRWRFKECDQWSLKSPASDTSEIRSSEARVRTISRVCPLSCVATVTSWTRPNESSGR